MKRYEKWSLWLGALTFLATTAIAYAAYTFDVEGRERDAPDIREAYIDPDVLPTGAYPQYILRNPGLRGTEVVGVEFLGKMMPVVAPGAHKIELKEGGADILHLMPCYLARAALPDGSVSEEDRFTLITGTEEGEKSIPLEPDTVERINAEIDSLRNTGTCVNGLESDISPLPVHDAAGNQIVPRQLLVPPTGN
ncbi:hypothetical protein [Corynebacterium kalidii]|uniref:DUF2993 domain-containing protein n=1 Tax=Corynebacterium kalidii TaxID=2931982 RepID=A0A9X2AYJ4_9CORY|nr:hypothetical protein [Corynebacterium kalidii]MCJ7857683.1 hypothetical protein [Corynebacterium kalidii]